MTAMNRSTAERIKELRDTAAERRLDFLFTGSFLTELTHLMGFDRVEIRWPGFVVRARPFDWAIDDAEPVVAPKASAPIDPDRLPTTWLALMERG